MAYFDKGKDGFVIFALASFLCTGIKYQIAFLSNFFLFKKEITSMLAYREWYVARASRIM